LGGIWEIIFSLSSGVGASLALCAEARKRGWGTSSPAPSPAAYPAHDVAFDTDPRLNDHFRARPDCFGSSRAPTRLLART
jgi:hypothetical protein